ncbi:hypothetical protein KUTeg_018171 [Tegillarca granosa]|uniref:Uncharacterized protein n=1 Tax=Tegillarca granosa TaxID=220873 RepID=A0ABQ9EMV1_TEGGR|nr:hypothetical protein KUTeg_018171 [Tegillarca granosa]
MFRVVREYNMLFVYVLGVAIHCGLKGMYEVIHALQHMCSQGIITLIPLTFSSIRTSNSQTEISPIRLYPEKRETS